MPGGQRQAGSLAERLSSRPPRRQIGERISRRRNLHQNGLQRRRGLDAVLPEAQLHAAVEFALDRPAARLGAADLAGRSVSSL